MDNWYKLLYNFCRLTLPGLHFILFFQNEDVISQLDEEDGDRNEKNRLA